MGFLSKAKATSVPKNRVEKRSTIWEVTDETVAEAINDLVKANTEAKALEGKMNLLKVKIKEKAEQLFAEEYAETGLAPEAPIVMQTKEGVKLNYIVQDRTSQYDVKEDQINELKSMNFPVDDMVYEENTFKFDRLIMAIPGVTEALDKAVTTAINKLVNTEVLTAEQAESLVVVDKKVAFKPGVLDRIGHYIAKVKNKSERAELVNSFLETAGSNFTRYVRV